MDLNLYRTVGNLNRVALGDLADGVDFYTAAKDDKGVITLTPVNVVDGARRNSAVQDVPIPGIEPVDSDETEPQPGETPWDE